MYTYNNKVNSRFFKFLLNLYSSNKKSNNIIKYNTCNLIELYLYPFISLKKR